MELKSFIRIIVITAMLMLATWLASPASANGLIYVDINNHGFQDGSPNHPFNGIQKGINHANGGDTIMVLPGIYFENVLFPTFKPGLILRSAAGPLTTVIDGQSRASVVHIIDSTTIDGFTIFNGGGDKGLRDNGYGIVVSADENFGLAMTVNIRNDIIVGNNVRGGVGLVANVYPIYLSASISRNRILGNSGSIGSSGAGINLDLIGGNPGDITIDNNVIYSNTASSAGGGLYLYSIGGPNGSINVINNTVYSNSASYGGGAAANAGGLSLVNNIFFGNRAGTGNELYLVQASLSAQVSHNIIGDGQFFGSNGNIASDPLLLDPANGDFHLRSTSPAIDAGTAISVSEDFDGDARPYHGPCGWLWDIGADEYYPAGHTAAEQISVPGLFDTGLHQRPEITYQIFLPFVTCSYR